MTTMPPRQENLNALFECLIEKYVYKSDFIIKE
jgi:hypothetical protein